MPQVFDYLGIQLFACSLSRLFGYRFGYAALGLFDYLLICQFGYLALQLFVNSAIQLFALSANQSFAHSSKIRQK